MISSKGLPQRPRFAVQKAPCPSRLVPYLIEIPARLLQTLFYTPQALQLRAHLKQSGRGSHSITHYREVAKEVNEARLLVRAMVLAGILRCTIAIYVKVCQSTSLPPWVKHRHATSVCRSGAAAQQFLSGVSQFAQVIHLVRPWLRRDWVLRADGLMESSKSHNRTDQRERNADWTAKLYFSYSLYLFCRTILAHWENWPSTSKWFEPRPRARAPRGRGRSLAIREPFARGSFQTSTLNAPTTPLPFRKRFIYMFSELIRSIPDFLTRGTIVIATRPPPGPDMGRHFWKGEGEGSGRARVWRGGDEEEGNEEEWRRK